jgi:hypothetical protein
METPFSFYGLKKGAFYHWIKKVLKNGNIKIGMAVKAIAMKML